MNQTVAKQSLAFAPDQAKKGISKRMCYEMYYKRTPQTVGESETNILYTV